MSTLPGGPADKAGLVHEALWGVHAMLQVLRGCAKAICIEEPGVDGAEFFLDRDGRREHWQAKRQVLSQENWSLQLLKTRGVLDFFLDRLRAGESCVFASISDAPELRVLAENASDAGTWDVYRDKFLGGNRRAHFDELRIHWNNIPEAEAFDYLLRIRVEGARECTLESLLLSVLQVMLSCTPQAALAVLHRLYETSVHQTLDADSIRRHLEACSIKPREFGISATMRDFLLGITESYVAGQRSKLIRAQLIPRQVASELANRVISSEQSLDLLLVGPAGGGKSASLLQFVEELRATHVPVLAFRLDRIEPVSSPEALGNKLGLPDSPAVVMARCFAGQSVVLVVDQLDYVSAASGRHPDFFDTVAALVEEVRGLRSFGLVHLVLACRQFDFDNDHRFRSLIPKKAPPISIGPFSEAEVADVIKAEHGDPSRLSPQQLELLRLPQNLSLFIEAGLAEARAPSFVSQKELFDAYWETKRRAVSSKRPNETAQWMPVVQRLADEMNVRQELSVPKARLDAFSPELLGVMVSEGVLTFDNRCYGFGHESFFDYCFARSWAAGDHEFVEFLEQDEQGLFRRAQLRQVIVYLRDDDPDRHLRNVNQALASDRIRPHLKLLVLELLAAFPNPRDAELGVLMPYLELELNCRRNQQPNANRMASRAFDTFFASRSLFGAADRLGHVSRWLHSGEPWLGDLMVGYLRWQTERHADRVAELLEPFVGKGGSWKSRLRSMMEWRNLEKGRRFFDLFLRLLDDGTLDDARDRFASNGTFWSMLGDLAKRQPSWFAELAGHWLDRRVIVALAAGEVEQGLSFNGEFGVQELYESARHAPTEFLTQVLPAIIRAAEAFAFRRETSLLHDGVWPNRYRGPYAGLGEAYLNCCETAFDILGKSDPNLLRGFISALRCKPLYTANHLLLSAYLTAPIVFAEEALCLLAAEPDRLLCGFSDSAHWVSRCVIQQCSPHCTEATFEKLEAVVLGYKTPFEKSDEGTECRGHAAFNLASALVASRRSASTNEQLAEWQKRFLEPDGPPQGIRTYSVVSPVPEHEAAGFSDEKWLETIAKHQADRGVPDWKHPEKGGASEFAVVLHKFTEKEPERFARLSLRFSTVTHPSYFMSILYALTGSSVVATLKCEVARRVFNSSSTACLKAALDLLGTVEETPLPDDAMRFITRVAVEHPDPSGDRRGAKPYKDANAIVSEGIDSVRGRGAEAVRALIRRDRRYLTAFDATLNTLVEDPSLAVRACVASALSAVAIHDVPHALALFTKLVDADDLLLATDPVFSFICAGLCNHAQKLRPFISRMLASKDEEVRRAGGRLACLARLYDASLHDLAETALAGDTACRMGAAKVAKDNFTHPNCNEWCEPKLKLLFNDPSDQVCKEAAGCFWHLWQQPHLPLVQFDSLIHAFLDSPAFAEEPTFLLHALEDTRQRVPEAILDVCEVFVARCAEQARDIRTSFAGDEMTVGKLVFRAYAQLESKVLRTRTLNLIDRMCEEGLQSAGEHFVEFER